MTPDHIAMLKWIQKSENPDWLFLCDNYPTGFLWSRVVVGDLLKDLHDAKMILHEDAQSNVQILQHGLDTLKLYAEQEAKDEHFQKMMYEQLSLDVGNLRNEFFDYATTKRNLKLALWLSGITIVVTVLIAIFKK